MNKVQNAMNETIVKLMQFHLALLGLSTANYNVVITLPQAAGYKSIKQLDAALDELYEELDYEEQVDFAWEFHQTYKVLKQYLNQERLMTKEQFIALATILTV